MPLPKREVIAALISKLAAVEARKTGHEVYQIWESGRMLGWTRVSHGKAGKEITDRVLGNMARNLGIRLDTFVRIVGCELFRDDYLREVAQRK